MPEDRASRDARAHAMPWCHVHASCLGINTLGEGRIGSPTANYNNTLYHAVTVEGKYPYLWDKAQ